jgi:hypothetical protein
VNDEVYYYRAYTEMTGIRDTHRVQFLDPIGEGQMKMSATKAQDNLGAERHRPSSQGTSRFNRKGGEAREKQG